MSPLIFQVITYVANLINTILRETQTRMKRSTLADFSICLRGPILCLASAWLLVSCTPLLFGDEPEAECASAADCGAGKRCVEGKCEALQYEVCDGLDNDLDGEADEGLLNACMTCGPTPDELCNGLDDDCDGSFDEGYDQLGELCYFADEENNRKLGSLRCSLNGRLSCQETPGISEELCDGEDNDQDGNIDEGIESITINCAETNAERICRATGEQSCQGGVLINTCVVGLANDDRSCDGIDSDCDGQVDEDYDGAELRCGDESCQITVREACIDGNVINRCERVLSMTGELCDGLDNDCDGEIDERDGLQVDPSVEGVELVGEPCNQGLCSARYRFFCSEGAGFVRCTDRLDYAPGLNDPYDQELAQLRFDWCGGGDEDCDGEVDEDSRPLVMGCPSSNLTGAYVCVDTMTAVGFPQHAHVMSGCPGNAVYPEVCNGLDDDQDGVIDNSPDMSCCEEGWEDEPDALGIDSNCDGLDGRVNGTIFVSALYGDDQVGHGTARAPYQSLARALNLASEIYERYEGKESPVAIYVSTGVYDLIPKVASQVPIKIYGGYEVELLGDELSWSRPPLSEAQAETILESTSARPAFQLLSPDSELVLQRLRIRVRDKENATPSPSNIGLILGACQRAELSDVQLVVGAAYRGQDGSPGELPSQDLEGFGDSNDGELPGAGGLNERCCSDLPCSGGSGGSPRESGQAGFKLGFAGEGGLGGDVSQATNEYAGQPGERGANGLSAVPTADRYGYFSAQDYLWNEAVESRVEAVDGEPGSGGGGGAGTPPLSFTRPQGGAGGGAGGCGGERGGAGSTGGWSVGIIMSERCEVSLQRVSVSTSRGGLGGAGGEGSLGQVGYLGGFGAITNSSGVSGDGGRGGPGGCGGHGSPGHGGSSVGLVSLGAQRLPNSSELSYVIGEPGQPGAPVVSARCGEGAQAELGQRVEALCCAALDEVTQRYTDCAPCAE